MALEITTRELRENLPLVEPVGEIEVYTAPDVKAELARIMDQGQFRLAISLDKVTFIDSRGIGVLVEATKRARENGGDLAVICTNQRFLRHIGILKLDEFLSIVSDEQAAAQRLAGSREEG